MFSHPTESCRKEMLENVIGQEKIKKAVTVAVTSARKRNTILDHILLLGEGGSGKTHLMDEIGKLLNYHVVHVQGNRFTKTQQINDFLIQVTTEALVAGKHALIGVDEIHEMSNKLLEDFYIPMDKYKILPDIALPKFTLVGATTHPHLLNSRSLIHRFKHRWQLVALSQNDLMYLLNKYFNNKKIECWFPCLEQIASRSFGNPRLALTYASKAFDYAICNDHSEITSEDVNAVFHELGIDELGLNDDQRQYLHILAGAGQSLSLRDITNRLGKQDEALVKNTIEPWLISRGLITSNQRGRKLTETGIRHLKNVHTVA